MKTFFSLFCLCFALCNVYAQNPISVEAFDEQGNNPVQVTLRLKITNNTSDTLYNVCAKYFLNYEKKRFLNISPYYMEGATKSIDTIGDYLAVNIKIAKLAPGIFPNSSGISLGLNYTDYNSFHKSDNFSYPGGNGFIITEKIPVYLDGNLCVGVAPGVLPDANPISLVSGSEILLDPSKRVRFAWREVEGANSYRLTVLSAADSTILIQKETEKSLVDTALNEGAYLWRVESSEYAVASGIWNSVVDATRYIWHSLFTLLDSVVVDSVSPLIAEPLGARKDTYLLDLKWGEMAVVREWDRPHLHHEHYDDEESYRCWVVAAEMLNHFYGGNITQDEIKLKFKKNGMTPIFKDSVSAVILGAFLHSSQGGADPGMLVVNDMLPWVLNDSTVLNRHDRSPTEDEVKNWLMDSIPLYIWTENHVVILDGYKKTINNKFFVRVVNTDNNGDTAWESLDSAKIEGFMAPQVVGSVRMSDTLIHMDSDGDSLMDYDEIMRFGTNPLHWDSDGDSIDDKTEIKSYTILEHISGKLSKAQLGIINLKYADIDADGNRAEHDLDSDNGGIGDILEDVNRNGLQDNGESSPYNAEDDFIIMEPVIDIPDTFTIYAMSELRINDGVNCRKYDKIVLNSSNDIACSVASESSNVEYSVNVGRSTILKAIASKGGVFLRDYSMVIDPIKIYSLPNFYLEPYIQGHAQIKSLSLCNLQSLWPYQIAQLPSMPSIGNVVKEVPYNESYTLKNGDNFKTLKVNSGGKLLIESGEMFVGNIQLESGSWVQFAEPGKRTVIHANGSTIWRSKSLNDDLVKVAKGFMLVQHSSELMFVEGQWAGTIFAPNADLILGQVYKTLYGRFLANNVSVHQYSTVYNVDFNPEIMSNLVFKME